MLEQGTAGDRCTKKKAACGSAAFPKKSRELKPAANTLKIGASRVKVKHGAAARRLGDLRRVIANGRAHDLSYWRVFGFLAANALCLFRPGRYFEPGLKVPRRWPEATVENALGPKDSPARAAIEALVDRHGTYLRERIYTAIAEGMREGERWTLKHRCLVRDQEAARRLLVDSDERDELQLRSIGAVDSTPEVRKLEARERKRERDRERIAAKRRNAGMRTWKERVAESAVAEAKRLGVSVRTIWRRRRNNQAVTVESLHNNDPYGIIENTVGDTTATRPTPKDDFSNDRMAPPSAPPGDVTPVPTSARSTSFENSSDSEKAIQLAHLEQNIAQRLPAPSGADCGRPQLSLSDLALLAVYAREKASGRIREAAR